MRTSMAIAGQYNADTSMRQMRRALHEHRYTPPIAAIHGSNARRLASTRDTKAPPTQDSHIAYCLQMTGGSRLFKRQCPKSLTGDRSTATGIRTSPPDPSGPHGPMPHSPVNCEAAVRAQVHRMPVCIIATGATVPPILTMFRNTSGVDQ